MRRRHPIFRFLRSQVVLAALSLAMSAVPVSAEPLGATVRDAYLYNPTLEAARARLRSVGENVPIAQAGSLPTLNLNSSAQLSRTFSTFGTTNTGAPLSLRLNGVLPLYDGGETANRVSQARANIDGAEATLFQTEQEVVLAAITAFFDVLRDKEIRDLTRQNLALLREELVGNEARFEVGEVTLTDVAQTKARVAEANSNVVFSDGNLRSSAERYRGIVGRLPGKLEPPELLPKLPETLLAAENVGLSNDPSIRAARAAERAAVHAIRVAMAGKLPDVSLGTTIDGTLADPLEGLDNTLTTSLTLQLQAPIYQGGATDSSVRQARHIASQRRSEYHAAVREVQQGVNLAWQQLVTARAAIEAGEERVAVAELAFQGVKEELLVGNRATIDVLNAEQERLEARISLVRSVRDYNVSAYALLEAMGLLDVELFGVPTLTQKGNGVAGVEPDSPYGYPSDALTKWRFPWRP